MLGEITSSAGEWGFSCELAPEDSHEQYRGVFGTGQQIANAIVPVVAGTFLIANDLFGCSIVAAVLLLMGLFALPAVAWALRLPPRSAMRPLPDDT